MGKTISCYVAFDPSMVEDKKAVLNSKQANALSFGQGVARLSPDLIYVIPKQWVHSRKLNAPINGVTHSNSIYAFGFDKGGNLVEVQELSTSTLTVRHYGSTDYDAPRIIAERNANNLWRVKTGQGHVNGVVNNGMVPFITVPIDDNNSNAYVPKNIALKLNKRGEFYVLGFESVSNGFDVKHVEDNGEDVVKFDTRALNIYDQVDADFTTDWEDVKGVAKAVFSELPK